MKFENMQIPIIDLGPLLGHEPDGARKVAQQLADAHTSVGFSMLVNHGVPQRIVADLFRASRTFHAWPPERKMALRYRTHLRGYLPLNTSVLKTSTLGAARRANYSDSFVILDELPESLRAAWEASAMGGTQPWPEIEGFEAAARQYRQALTRLGHSLLHCIADMLGVPHEFLAVYFARPSLILRLLHYPAVPVAEPDLFGSAPHTDYGCLTFVAQDDVGGLQVQSGHGHWFDVPVVPGSFVLNTGQVLARWSGGTIRPTPHRVVNHRSKDRYSIAFFYDCGLDTPLDFDVDIHGQSDSTATYGEHLENILRANNSFVRP